MIIGDVFRTEARREDGKTELFEGRTIVTTFDHFKQLTEQLAFSKEKTTFEGAKE